MRSPPRRRRFSWPRTASSPTSACSTPSSLRDGPTTPERLQRREPDHHRTHRSLGRLALVRRRAKEAEGHFREALRVRADDATTLSLLGRAIELQHRPKRAIGIHQLAVQSDPRSQVARQALLRATRSHLGLTLAVITAGLSAI